MKSLLKDLANCHKIIQELVEEIIPSLMEEIEKLKTQINQNNNNSHPLLSTDKNRKPKTKSAFPQRKGKKNGG